jgi:hypothetical protein
MQHQLYFNNNRMNWFEQSCKIVDNYFKSTSKPVLFMIKNYNSSGQMATGLHDYVVYCMVIDKMEELAHEMK